MHGENPKLIHNVLVSYNEELLAVAEHPLPLFLLSHGCLWMLQLLPLYMYMTWGFTIAHWQGLRSSWLST